MTDPHSPVETEPTRRLSAAELSVQSEVSAARIADFVARGIIAPPDDEGTYDPGDVTRLRLLKALEASGVDMGALGNAVTAGRLSLAFAGSVVADRVGLAPITVADACNAIGLSRGGFEQLMLGMGIAVPDADQHIREDDLELLNIYVKARATGLSETVLMHVLRAFAINMRRLVEAQRELFRQHVEAPMLAKGLSYADMFTQSAAMRGPLQRLGYRAAFILQRRLLEQTVYENMVARLDEALEANAMRHDRSKVETIAFVDLSGFTERTESYGDADAAAVGSVLVEIAQAETTRHHGHLVKPLGDGAMLRFSKSADAVHGTLSVLGKVRDRGLPPARAGVACGPLVMQDGDYYGRTVNRAARLLGVANPNQVLVTAEVARTIRADVRLALTDLGKVRLKGVADEVEAFAAGHA